MLADFAFDWVSALAAAGGGLAFTVILGMIGAWRILGAEAGGVFARVVIRKIGCGRRPVSVDSPSEDGRHETPIDRGLRKGGRRRNEGANAMAELTQSYVHGASATPLIGETIGALLRRVRRGPGRIAQIGRHQNVRWTYAELLRALRGPRGRAPGARPHRRATGSASGRPIAANGCSPSSARRSPG